MWKPFLVCRQYKIAHWWKLTCGSYRTFFFACMEASGKAGSETSLVISFSLLVTGIDMSLGNISGPNHKEKSAGKGFFSFKIDVKNLPFGLGWEYMEWWMHGAASHILTIER